MRAPVRHLIQRVVAVATLVGYLVAAGENGLPDDHDWHRLEATSTVSATTDSVPAPLPLPAHPVHVCHDGHQHVVAVEAGVAMTPGLQVPARLGSLSVLPPISPPPSTFFRPPIA